MQRNFLVAVHLSRSIRNVAACTACLALAAAGYPALCAAGNTSKGEAERLIAAAASAEASGAHSHAQALLRDAIKADPDDQRAHWQLGQVHVDGKWLTADEAQRKASADPLQVEY